MKLHDQRTSEVTDLFDLHFYSTVNQVKSGKELKKIRHKKVRNDLEVMGGGGGDSEWLTPRLLSLLSFKNPELPNKR